MTIYTRQGQLPRKKHTTFYKSDGKQLYREELVSSRGFDGIYSTKYHVHEPTRLLGVEELHVDGPGSESGPLNYYHFRSDDQVGGGNFIGSRECYMRNASLEISIAHVTEATEHFYKNAYAHECLFVHHGSGIMESEYGLLPFGPGDHIVIPKGIIYHLRCDDYKKTKLLVIESRDPFDIPKRYRNEYGQLLEHAPYCERDFTAPSLQDPHDEMGEFTVHIKAGQRHFLHHVDHHPFDVVGWDGCWYPFTFNIHDFSPIVGKLHLPPPVHQLFHCGSFVICNFVPRPFDFHPEAVPVPYFHTNVDSCEVLYYMDGDFMSRSGVDSGSLTLHPTGLPHGPQPGKTEESIGETSTDEYAVMIDTFEPLNVTDLALKRQVADYAQSWL